MATLPSQQHPGYRLFPYVGQTQEHCRDPRNSCLCGFRRWQDPWSSGCSRCDTCRPFPTTDTIQCLGCQRIGLRRHVLAKSLPRLDEMAFCATHLSRRSPALVRISSFRSPATCGPGGVDHGHWRDLRHWAALWRRAWVVTRSHWRWVASMRKSRPFRWAAARTKELCLPPPSWALQVAVPLPSAQDSISRKQK